MQASSGHLALSGACRLNRATHSSLAGTGGRHGRPVAVGGRDDHHGRTCGWSCVTPARTRASPPQRSGCQRLAEVSSDVMSAGRLPTCGNAPASPSCSPLRLAGCGAPGRHGAAGEQRLKGCRRPQSLLFTLAAS